MESAHSLALALAAVGDHLEPTPPPTPRPSPASIEHHRVYKFNHRWYVGVSLIQTLCVSSGTCYLLYQGSLFSTLTQEMAEVFLLPEVEPSVWKYVEYCPGQGPAICAGYKLNGHC